MLKIYKNYIIAALFLIYSLGLWNVCKTYTQSSYKDEKIALQASILETKEQRAKLAADIGNSLETKLQALQITNKTIYQKVIHETTKEPVYTDCVTTPTGVQLIEDAIDSGKRTSSHK